MTSPSWRDEKLTGWRLGVAIGAAVLTPWIGFGLWWLLG